MREVVNVYDFLKPSLGLVKTSVDLSIRMYPYAKVWDQNLAGLVQTAGLSPRAKLYIECENRRTESGREGFLGVAACLMEGYDPRGRALSEIWSDTAFHLFALRVIDDYVDESNLDQTSARKINSLDWSAISRSKKASEFQSPEQEAAIFMATACNNRFAGFGNYFEKISQLYNLVRTVEILRDQPGQAKKTDLQVAVYTITPIFEILQGRGYPLSEDVKEAIVCLTLGARTMDHLGDLQKDLSTGVYNPLIEEARSQLAGEVEGRNDVIGYVKQNLGSCYFSEAMEEFRRGRLLLDGRSRDLYTTLALFVIAKYGIQYMLSVNPNISSMITPRLKRVIRSF